MRLYRNILNVFPKRLNNKYSQRRYYFYVKLNFNRNFKYQHNLD